MPLPISTERYYLCDYIYHHSLFKIMITREDIERVLSDVTHPETNQDIVSGGILDSVNIDKDKIAISLAFSRSRDPFASSIKRAAEQLLKEKFPDYTDGVSIVIKEKPQEKTTKKQPEKISFTDRIGKIIAVSSAKGGVGKSTVTANLAVTLTGMGYKVGILDADIYGPSMPMMFGVADYKPGVEMVGDTQAMMPAESYGVKIMSIGFFINPDDALIWRGPMATSALKQMIHQTAWDKLDFLLIDMPPGTGDVHLTLLSELKIDGAIIVSTPQQIALADVVRGISMFRSEHINIPVLGMIENMSWFTPTELPNNKYYIFGREGAKKIAAAQGIDLLGEVPLVQSVREGSDYGHPAATDPNAIVNVYYRKIADKLLTDTTT